MNPASKFSESSNFSFNGFAISLLLVFQSFFAAGQGVNFELITGTHKNDDAKCVIQTLDSGYAVVGSTSGFGNGQSDIYLTKISKTGSVTWQQAIGGAGVDIGNSVIQTSDSGFAITGYSNSAGTGGYDVYLARTDKMGVLLWEKYYGGIDWDFGNSIIQTTSGDLVVCGSTYSYGNGNGDVYLLKTDSTGILLWDSAYGGSLEDVGNSVCPTNDEGYFICGQSKSFGTGNNDVYLLKIDSLGTLKWEKTYGGSGDESGNECKLTADGRNIVICSSNSFSSSNKYENWLMKINALGDTLWSRRDSAPFNRLATSVSQTIDGGYIFTGHDDNAGQYNMFLYKTDAGGYYQDYKNYGGLQTENAFSVKQTFDKGYIVVGVTESYGTGTPNIYVLKTNDTLVSSGTIVIVVGVEENGSDPSLISLFPNPATEYFTVNSKEDAVLEIFDTMGKLIFGKTINCGNNHIPTGDIADGIYFIKICSKKHIITAKIIIRH